MSFIEMLRELYGLVEETCQRETNIFGYEIWQYHIVDVIKFSKMLARRLGADEEIVEIAALLHDYASVKDEALYQEHHIHGAVLAEELLRQYDYPSKKIETIKECILSHRNSVPIERSSLEAICVASADAMAHISQVPSLLHLVYVKKKLSIDEGANWVKNKIIKSWNKLCPEAREMVKDKYLSAQIILNLNESASFRV